jgi:hypothetical protein
MNYLSKEKGYEKYVRSPHPHNFEPYEKESASVCWIDLLGVRDKSHLEITNAIDTILVTADECSSVGAVFDDKVMAGTPQSSFQYCLVGDALVMAENDLIETPDSATLAFLRTVSYFSGKLNEQGYLHRGVITYGAVKCFVHDKTPIITGKGIVDAVKLESKLKIAGLFYDEKIETFINSNRKHQIEKDSFCVSLASVNNWSGLYAPHLRGVCFSQYKGWENWNIVIQSASDPKNDKVINTKNLLSELKSTYSLP